ncbi:MAG: RnfH family protein [Pseudomonadota bacterium]
MDEVVTDSDAVLLEVEVAVAWPKHQVSVTVQLPQGASVADAIVASGLAERFPELEISPERLGVFAELRKPDDLLQTGDRVEIYRPLTADPKEIRREMAQRKAGLGKISLAKPDIQAGGSGNTGSS